jgi:hypothetical protein
MSIYYRAADGGFYFADWFGSRELMIPDPDWRTPDNTPDAVAPMVAVPNPDCRLPPAAELVEISTEEHQALLAAEMAGQVIRADDQGRPITVPALPISPEQLAVRERLWRDAMLSSTDALVQRHRDEVEAGSGTTLTADQYQTLQAYRIELRAWPDNEGFPEELQRPAAPAWLTDLL